MKRVETGGGEREECERVTDSEQKEGRRRVVRWMRKLS